MRRQSGGGPPGARGSQPGQAATGIGGYLAYRGSPLWRSHSEKTDPRVVRTSRCHEQEEQSPAGGRSVAIAVQDGRARPAGPVNPPS